MRRLKKVVYIYSIRIESRCSQLGCTILRGGFCNCWHLESNFYIYISRENMQLSNKLTVFSDHFIEHGDHKLLQGCSSCIVDHAIFACLQDGADI
jgi:hypothetical protein